MLIKGEILLARSLEQTKDTSYSPKTVSSNSDQSLGAKLGGEAPSVIKSVKDERGELEHFLMRVVEPRATRERKNGG